MCVLTWACVDISPFSGSFLFSSMGFQQVYIGSSSVQVEFEVISSHGDPPHSHQFLIELLWSLLRCCCLLPWVPEKCRCQCEMLCPWLFSFDRCPTWSGTLWVGCARGWQQGGALEHDTWRWILNVLSCIRDLIWKWNSIERLVLRVLTWVTAPVT